MLCFCVGSCLFAFGHYVKSCNICIVHEVAAKGDCSRFWIDFCTIGA